MKQFLGLIIMMIVVSAQKRSLNPYEQGHGPSITHHELRALMQEDLKEIVPGYQRNPQDNGPTVSTVVSLKNYNEKLVPIRLSTLNSDPVSSFSIVEPGGYGGCTNGDHRSRVSETAGKICLVAGNGGYFNTRNGQCYGNLVSDGRLIQNTGLQNANFGVRKDGSIVVGYLSHEDVDNPDNPFVNLVAGVIWLVRDGVNYVNQSSAIEDMSIQETGLQFVSMISARAALGHDRQGRLMLAQVDGKSYQRGINLYEFADFLVAHGIINAINLDGGGSMTSVINGTVVNIPSDECSDNQEYFCERKVTTIVCFHEQYCNGTQCPPKEDKCTNNTQPTCYNNCSYRGICHYGKCICNKTWSGESCDVASCPLVPEPEDVSPTFSTTTIFIAGGILVSGIIGVTAFSVWYICFKKKVEPELVYSPHPEDGNQELVGLTKDDENDDITNEISEDE